jgi:energy-converting hydrogenase A subunit M
MDKRHADFERKYDGLATRNAEGDNRNAALENMMDDIRRRDAALERKYDESTALNLELKNAMAEMRQMMARTHRP